MQALHLKKQREYRYVNNKGNKPENFAQQGCM